jgi:hypothetical protein
MHGNDHWGKENHDDPNEVPGTDGNVFEPLGEKVDSELKWTGAPIIGVNPGQVNFRVTNFKDPENLARIDNLPDDLMVPVIWVEKVSHS